MTELNVLTSAVKEITDLSLKAFLNNDLEAAMSVEPLEEVIDRLKEKARSRHIRRLQQGDCSIEAGFVYSDLLTNLERVSDHCSNIALCIIDIADNNMDMHRSQKEMQEDGGNFERRYKEYKGKYSLN